MLFANMFSRDYKNGDILICYGKLVPGAINGYSSVILEPIYYSSEDIKKIKLRNGKVFAYISLGEVSKDAPHYAFLKDDTLGKNELWNSYYLNLKSEKTITILSNIIDNLFTSGYDGLFLDNVDNFTVFGPQKDQKNELVNLIKFIRTNYPDKQLIQNAGLEIISETCFYISAIVIESVASNYNLNSKKYGLRNRIEFENKILQLNIINKAYKLPIILVEYAHTKELYTSIKKRIIPTKYPYFIGYIELQVIPKF